MMPGVVQLTPLDSISESAASSNGANGGGAPDDDSGRPPRRKRTSSARQKVERVAHERAPGLATIVAGHNGVFQGRMSGRTRRGSHNGSGAKRYSAPEFQHLVPDESGELHDPEYEGIKIVQRKPSSSSTHSSSSGVSSVSTEEEDTTGLGLGFTSPTSSSRTAYTNYSYLPPPQSGRRTTNKAYNTSGASSSGTRHYSSSFNYNTGSSLGAPSTSYASTSRIGSMAEAEARSMRTVGGSSLRAGQSSVLAPPTMRAASTSSRSSTDRSSRHRNYTGNGVTYIAPSLTMPPPASSASYGGSTMTATEQYNPVRSLVLFQ